MDGNFIWWLECVIQLCRLQVQREREKLAMTPKMRGVLDSLKQMKSFADDEADKLTRRISDETMPALKEGFTTAHASVTEMHGAVDDIAQFADELKKTNGGESLGNSEQHSARSSEVASR